MNTRKHADIQRGLTLDKSSKSLWNIFNFISKKEEPKPKKSAARRRKKTVTAFEVYTDTNGSIVKCTIDENNRLVTESGALFSGTVKKVSASGEETFIKCKDGHKIEENTSTGTKTLYTETGTTTLDKNRETISEMSINDSLINEDCKSMVYHNDEIKFARIDFNNSENGANFAGLEIRQDGIVGGISQTGGKWHIYFSESGQDISRRESDDYRLYTQVKNILKEFKENSLLAENNPIDAVEEQIDGIYNNILK